MTPHYSRHAIAALSRGEVADPESYDVRSNEGRVFIRGLAQCVGTPRCHGQEVRVMVHALQKHARSLQFATWGDRNSQRKRELLDEARGSLKMAERLSRLASGSSLEVTP